MARAARGRALPRQVRLPARQLDEPLEGDTERCRALERERDQLNRSANGLGRDVLAGLWAARLLHRDNDLMMPRGRGRELPLGLGA
jgi:hypothetical protein